MTGFSLPTSRQIRHLITRHPWVDRPLTWLQHRGLRATDALVAAYPRSGSTWLRFMLYELLTGQESSFSDVDRVLPDIGRHFNAPALLPNGGRLLKTHEPYRLGYGRAIYLVRDVRDVLISEYQFCVREGFFQGDLAHFFPLFLAGRVNRYGAWTAHVRSWLDAAARAPGNILVIRFEELRVSPAQVVARCLDHLGINRSPAQIDLAVANHVLSRMQAKEDDAEKFRTSARGLRFVTDGAVGKGKQQLTPEQSKRLLADASTELNRLAQLGDAPLPPVRVVVVGQTPPPVHGQAVMIQTMLEGDYPGVELIHVPMSFSKELDEVGRFRLGKLSELVALIRRIRTVQRETGATTLYYPPAGPNRIPMWRDVAILLATRHRFRRTILHFHAGGLTDELYPKLTPLERALFTRAYGRPDATIRMTPRTPAHIDILHPRADHIVPYGIPDPGCVQDAAPAQKVPSSTARILFVGALRESKGVLVLLEACRLLATRGVAWELDLMGGFHAPDFETTLRALLQDPLLADRVQLLGVRTGPDKDAAYRRADIFCFPTFYESEAFSVVLVEALSYGLPIVTTHWRGIPDIVPDGKCGLLVPIRDAKAVAGAVETLTHDPALRRQMSAAARARYLAHYTEDRFRNSLREVFLGKA
jgi:glycosyltransferase involved in cell wall biosynthesis